MSTAGWFVLALAFYGAMVMISWTAFMISWVYRELADARAERRRIKPPPRQPMTDMRVRFPAKGR